VKGGAPAGHLFRARGLWNRLSLRVRLITLICVRKFLMTRMGWGARVVAEGCRIIRVIPGWCTKPEFIRADCEITFLFIQRGSGKQEKAGFLRIRNTDFWLIQGPILPVCFWPIGWVPDQLTIGKLRKWGGGAGHLNCKNLVSIQRFPILFRFS
jgi:hypothetical protein